jgi:NAD(P)-dependent dehydrogenase (short-subunit alcohol dehydrogenase family)
MGYFTNKVAIVTGGASGIGKAVAIELARNGADVIAADIDLLGVAQTAELIKQTGVNAEAAHVDVARGQDVETLVENTVANRGHLDYIFNIAGVAVMGEVRDLSLDHWRRIVDVNVLGVIQGATAAYRVMLKQGTGHIVNMASLAGLVGYPIMSAYAMTKAAVVAFSTNLRAEAEAFGVKVTALCPGFV